MSETKLFLIIVNVLGHPKGVGGLTSNFLCGGGMDVFWNDPFWSWSHIETPCIFYWISNQDFPHLIQVSVPTVKNMVRHWLANQSSTNSQKHCSLTSKPKQYQLQSKTWFDIDQQTKAVPTVKNIVHWLANQSMWFWGQFCEGIHCSCFDM
jgi:hypothetical protein